MLTATQVWERMYQEAQSLAQQEPLLAHFLEHTLFNKPNLHSALADYLGSKLANTQMPHTGLKDVMAEAFAADHTIIEAAARDIYAIFDRDPAVWDWTTPFLYLKGFHALQTYRIAHWLWTHKRVALAVYLQNQASTVFHVDIHPAARIGQGILLDHATGIVVGETTIIENDVSLLQGVTLGGTGKESGIRHPKICEGVMVGAGAQVLGNIEIGRGAKIGAGSVVLTDVPPHTTVAGVPARIVGRPNCEKPALAMNQSL